MDRRQGRASACHVPHIIRPVQARQLAIAILACCLLTWQRGLTTSQRRLPSLASLASVRQQQQPRPGLPQLRMKLPRHRDAGRKPLHQSLGLLMDTRNLELASPPRRPSVVARQLLLLTPPRGPCHQVSCAGIGEVCWLQSQLRGGFATQVLFGSQGAACIVYVCLSACWAAGSYTCCLMLVSCTQVHQMPSCKLAQACSARQALPKASRAARTGSLTWMMPCLWQLLRQPVTCLVLQQRRQQAAGGLAKAVAPEAGDEGRVEGVLPAGAEALRRPW